ncbi:MAG: hypothetical protein AB8B69_04195 [Chitinophagales bacterium]
MKKRPHLLFLLFILLWIVLVFISTNQLYPQTFLGSFLETLGGNVIGEEVTFIDQLRPWLFQIPFLSIVVLSFLFLKKYVGKTEANYKGLVLFASITTFLTFLHAYSYIQWMANESYSVHISDSIILVPILMLVITVFFVKEGRGIR